jgi:hypothetical protein
MMVLSIADRQILGFANFFVGRTPRTKWVQISQSSSLLDLP